MRSSRNRKLAAFRRRAKWRMLAPPMAVMAAWLLAGCKANPSELRGKTSFGPEFRNRGNNTSEVRYDARQALEMKWDNGWTTAVAYRRRDVDDGSGDNENRVLFEVGYPLWKAHKKEEPKKEGAAPPGTAHTLNDLQKQVEEMRARVSALQTPATPEGSKVAQATH